MRLHRAVSAIAAVATTRLAASPVITGEQVGRLAVAKPKPEYPLAARARHLTGGGTFILQIQVRTGLVRYVDVEHSAGSALLDSAAITALKKWRFRPGTLPHNREDAAGALVSLSYRGLNHYHWDNIHAQ